MKVRARILGNYLQDQLLKVGGKLKKNRVNTKTHHLISTSELKINEKENKRAQLKT